MKLSREFGRAVCGLVVLALVAAVATAGVRVPLEKVPAPAVKTVKDRFAKAEIRFVDKEGNGTYEFAMKEGDRQFDVGVSAEGKFLHVKEEITADKVPAAVKEGVQKKFPGGKIIEAEKTTTGEGDSTKVTYELVVQTDKSKQAAAFDATGKYLGAPD